jgi:hypothetical protein
VRGERSKCGGRRDRNTSSARSSETSFRDPQQHHHTTLCSPRSTRRCSSISIYSRTVFVATTHQHWAGVETLAHLGIQSLACKVDLPPKLGGISKKSWTDVLPHQLPPSFHMTRVASILLRAGGMRSINIILAVVALIGSITQVAPTPPPPENAGANAVFVASKPRSGQAFTRLRRASVDDASSVDVPAKTAIPVSQNATAPSASSNTTRQQIVSIRCNASNTNLSNATEGCAFDLSTLEEDLRFQAAEEEMKVSIRFTGSHIGCLFSLR